MVTGKHLIAGEPVSSDETFRNAPVEGSADIFCKGSPELVDRAAASAEASFAAFAETPRAARAALLRRIAEEIEARGAALTEIGMRETGLPAARLDGERGRTTGQLRVFAAHVEAGDYLDRRHDSAQPERTPAPRPRLDLMQHPVGPVAVFGASNFPLAFSVAGGDTASALAAGCPVVVKGHEAHPGVSEIVADAIAVAVREQGMHPGVFSLVQGGGPEVGAALVRHPLIQAVGFTGSLRGGRALFDLCASRPTPIPFYGELGSINPGFCLPHALAARGGAIAEGWAASLTMGAGQFCTNPGVLFMLDGPDADGFAQTATRALARTVEQTMLTDAIATSFHEGCGAMASIGGVETLLASAPADRRAGPCLLQTTAGVWRANPALRHEVFGPVGLIVRVTDIAGMTALAAELEGQLTCTLHLDPDDTDAARPLTSVLRRKAGRILANGFSTGVEVADAMVHGGPYPASTNFGATAVGTLAIRRWLRPVCYQNMPEALLPDDLRAPG